MNDLHGPNHFGNSKLIDHDQGPSWPAIVDLIFDIVAHRDRLALERKALGRHKRTLARRSRKHRGRP
jgi:hypothetical protein